MKILLQILSLVLVALLVSCGNKATVDKYKKVPFPSSDRSWKERHRNQQWIVYEKVFGEDSPPKIYVAKLVNGQVTFSYDFVKYARMFYSDSTQVVVEPSFVAFNEEGFPVVAFGSYGHILIRK